MFPAPGTARGISRCGDTFLTTEMPNSFFGGEDGACE
jgi:hypothetical protein